MRKSHCAGGFSVAALLCAAGLMARPTQAAENVDLLIRSASVVDVRSGTLDAERSIVIRRGDIIAIGDAAIAGRYRAARNVDAGGRFAIPGLWDMHVHFGGGETLIAENRALLPLYVAHGVTAVRDAAADIASSVLESSGVMPSPGARCPARPSSHRGRNSRATSRPGRERSKSVRLLR